MELSKNALTVLQDFYGRKTLVRIDYQHAVDICSAIKLDKIHLQCFVLASGSSPSHNWLWQEFHDL